MYVCMYVRMFHYNYHMIYKEAVHKDKVSVEAYGR